MRTLLRPTAALVGAFALTTALAAPASAESVTVRDPDDTPHGSDLRAVEVDHGRKVITVTTTHSDLRPAPSSGSSGVVFLDTDRAERGPEYAVSGGFFRGTDYALYTVDGFGPDDVGERVDGSYRMRVDYDAEQVTFRIARATLDKPAEVRVAVKVSGTRPDGSRKGLGDWLGEPRSLTPWVARG